MYPTISDFLNDIFGINLTLPIQSFGFFLAIAFLVAAIIVFNELKRKEKQGLISPITKTKIIGKPISIINLFITAFIAFVVSYKFIDAILNYTIFVENPAFFIFSTRGNLISGIIISFTSIAIQYIFKHKHRL